MAEKLKFVLEMVENIVGKGENAGNQYFLQFKQYLKRFLQYYYGKHRDFLYRKPDHLCFEGCTVLQNDAFAN